jgi:metal-responsive CopG/Arc/MetJ family transcriptional regulator
VNVDFAQPMLNELDNVATEMNVPRQSLIKTMVREALDRYHMASRARKAK